MRVFGRSSRCGFTLVEILIAIGIFSIIVAAIYACWSAVLRSSKVGLEAAARAQRSRMALQSMEEALMYAKMHAANPDIYWFEGNSGSDARLSFVAKLPASFPRGGKFGGLTLRRVEFSIRPGPDQSRELVLRQAPVLMDFDVDEENFPLVLARNVDEMEVEFFDPQVEMWIDEWTATNLIPPVVRVSIVTERGRPPNTRKTRSTIEVNPAAQAVQAANQGRGQPPAPVPGGGRVPQPNPGQPNLPGGIPPGQPGVPR
jgi:type II secretion system protein J